MQKVRILKSFMMNSQLDSVQGRSDEVAVDVTKVFIDAYNCLTSSVSSLTQSLFCHQFSKRRQSTMV